MKGRTVKGLCFLIFVTGVMLASGATVQAQDQGQVPDQGQGPDQGQLPDQGLAPGQRQVPDRQQTPGKEEKSKPKEPGRSSARSAPWPRGSIRLMIFSVTKSATTSTGTTHVSSSNCSMQGGKLLRSR